MATVEQRLATLEKELAELKEGNGIHAPKRNWLERVAGTFKDDPEFGEILRLGREIRKSEKMDAAEEDA